MLIALLLASLTLGVTKAQADSINLPPVGITFGQTARVTAANDKIRGTPAVILYSFYNDDGVVIGQSDSLVVEPGKMMSFDLNADDIGRETNRIQIRVVISGDGLRDLSTSMEVFENTTGKTTVFIGRNDGRLQQLP